MSTKRVLAVLLVAVMLLAGCATAGVVNLGTQQLPDGSVVTSVATMSPDPWGIDGKTVDRYQTSATFNEHTRKYAPKSTLVKGDAGFTDGLGKQAVVHIGAAAVQGAEMGLGMWWAAKVLRPSNVTAGNNSGNNSQGQGQVQGQKQQMKQGQGQIQGQSTKVDNKVTNTNLNTNLNNNSNKNTNTATGGAVIGSGNSSNLNVNTVSPKITATGGNATTGPITNTNTNKFNTGSLYGTINYGGITQ